MGVRTSGHQKRLGALDVPEGRGRVHGCHEIVFAPVAAPALQAVDEPREERVKHLRIVALVERHAPERLSERRHGTPSALRERVGARLEQRDHRERELRAAGVVQRRQPRAALPKVGIFPVADQLVDATPLSLRKRKKPRVSVIDTCYGLYGGWGGASGWGVVGGALSRQNNCRSENFSPC